MTNSMSNASTESKRIRNVRLSLAREIPKFPNDRATLQLLEQMRLTEEGMQNVGTLGGNSSASRGANASPRITYYYWHSNFLLFESANNNFNLENRELFSHCS